MLLNTNPLYKVIALAREKRAFSDESGPSEISKKIKASQDDEIGTLLGFVVKCTKSQFKRLKNLSKKFSIYFKRSKKL